jgi:alpha-glucoside transport system substrate-binding protein
MRKRFVRFFIVLAALALVAAACGDDDDVTPTAAPGTAAPPAATDAPMAEPADFTLFGAPTGVELDAMIGFLNVYNAEKGTDIAFVGSSDFETQLRIRVDGGNPPAVALTPQPGSICVFADDGHLTSLEDMGFDIAEMETNHGKFWMDLGLCADGQHYGIPWFPNYKSIIHYNKTAFDAAGYQIPVTWEDLIALSEQMVADGTAPWCFGFGAGGATGWPGTDWIEDIFVRTAGADAYTQWFKHEIPFNDPRVVEAFDLLGEIIFPDGFVNGGAENIAAITFQDSPLPMFNDPPSCYMLKQGSFISNFFPVDKEDQASFFPFPSIDGNAGAMGGGDTIMVFDPSPENIQTVKDWISPEWQCVLASPSGGTASTRGGHGIAGVERLPGHKDVDPECYETEGSKILAETITTALAANLFVFDGGDLMPPEVGQGTFWTGMVDFTRGTSAQDVADAVEASWPAMDG